MDGWKTTFLLGRPILRCYVTFREGIFWEVCRDWDSGMVAFRKDFLDYRNRLKTNHQMVYFVLNRLAPFALKQNNQTPPGDSSRDSFIP